MMNFFLKREKHDDLDQVVFEHRHKGYGAYALRDEYDQILSRSLMIGIAFIASIAVVPFIINATKSNLIVKEPTDSERVLVIIPPDVVTPQKPDNAIMPTNVKTVNTTVPTPSRTVVVQKTVPTTDEMKGAIAGPETKNGPEVLTPNIPQGPSHTFSGQVPSVPKPIPTVDPNKIETKVDVSASFVGGIDVFRSKVGQSLDTSVLDQSGLIKANVSFVVEKDGSISNVKATGADADFNREAERTVKSIKTKWNPAKLNGEIVRSYFNIPITMRIE